MPLHIIFRSSSLVVSLIFSIFSGTRYSLQKLASVFLVTVGVIMSTLASSPKKSITSESVSDENADFLSWIIGLAILTVALVLSAFLGLYQQKIYERYGKHWKEGLFFTHFFTLP
ncbi:hypothetical protein HK096_000275, partial [Nowakowskiella sp. JEL0078]